MNNEIEISPLYNSLILEIEALTKEYTVLWEEKERLLNQVKAVLLVKYNLEIGQYILSYLNKHLYFLKLKTKIELLQKHINQNKQVQMNEINEMINAEYKEWIDRIFTLENDIRTAKKTIFERINEDDFKKIQEIYRKLVRKLNPDLNKNLTVSQKISWNRIQEAYKNLDLKELTNLEIIAGIEDDVLEISTIDALMKKKEDLWNKFQILARSLEDVQNSFPLSLEKELNDPNWIKKDAELYKNKEKEISAILPEYEKMYRDILFQLNGSTEERPEN